MTEPDIDKAEKTESPGQTPAAAARLPRISKFEWLGFVLLAAIAVYFLSISWRKWSDPAVDAGSQWYGAWRVSNGALLYHNELVWNYGPLSAFFNAGLFKIFGPGMMVLVVANLVIYTLIAALAYAACRVAWGRLAAFAATVVFISFFSFLQLRKIGNYTYAGPYAHESTHGMLLILVTAFVAVRWALQSSRRSAFFLGLCGGLATVLKPEFMLAGGAVGIAALIVRWRQRIRTSLAELALVAGGLALPTLAFTAWFARVEPLRSAFIDASRAWWLVVVEQVQRGSAQYETFAGFDDPARYGLEELKASLIVAAVLAAIWLAGWALNRARTGAIRLAILAGVCIVAMFIRVGNTSAPPGIEGHFLPPPLGTIQFAGGWMNIGRCLPVLCVVLLACVIWRLTRELRESRRASNSTVMALMFTLLALTMLARMILRSRVYHLGFYQAAFAGMAVTAAAVYYLPRWTGTGAWGRWFAVSACFAVLASGGVNLAAESNRIRADLDLTEPVGEGRDFFYAVNRKYDATGALVNWAATKLRSVPAGATVCVLPGGEMINYLSRHVNPIATYSDPKNEEKFLDELRRVSPDYIVWIWRDMEEYHIKRFGAPDNPGHLVRNWVMENYIVFDQLGDNPLADESRPGGVLMRRKSAVGTKEQAQ